MGGLVSKNKTYSFEELLSIPRQSVLNYWIKEDEITIQMIDDFINAVYNNKVSNNFPSLDIDLLTFVDKDLCDIDNLKRYREMLLENIERMRLLIQEDEKVRHLDSSLIAFK